MTLGLLPTPTWPADRRMAVGNPALQPRRDLVFGAWYSASVVIGATAGVVTLAVAAFPFSTVATLFGVAAAGAIAGTLLAMASGWVIALAISLVGWTHPPPERSLVLRTRLTGGFVMLLVYLPITWAAFALTEYGTWWLHIPVPASLIAGWVFAPSLVQRTSTAVQSAATNPGAWEPAGSDTALTSRGDTLLADDDPGATA